MCTFYTGIQLHSDGLTLARANFVLVEEIDQIHSCDVFVPYFAVVVNVHYDWMRRTKTMGVRPSCTSVM
jgi:hypothetical protein